MDPAKAHRDARDVREPSARRSPAAQPPAAESKVETHADTESEGQVDADAGSGAAPASASGSGPGPGAASATGVGVGVGSGSGFGPGQPEECRLEGRSGLDARLVDAYLRRLGFDAPRSASGSVAGGSGSGFGSGGNPVLPAPTLELLRELHLRHLRAVPFENLSVHLGDEIVLEERRLVEKVVQGRRGGFCYELNGAFGALLGALGFEVTLLAARVYGEEGRLGIPYDHLALLVRTADAGEWLADVGFGAHSHHPLDWGRRDEQPDPGGVFRIVEAGPYPTGAGSGAGSAAVRDLDVVVNGAPVYRLETRPRALRDFVAGAWWHSSSPESHFTRSLICSRLTEDGGGSRSAGVG